MFKDKYKNLSIKYKLLLLLYVQVFLPLVFLGFIYYQKTENIMESHAVELSLDMLKNIELRVDDYMNNVSVLSRDLLLDQEVYEVLNDERSDVFEYYGKVNRLKNILRKRAISYEAIQSITIIAQDGQIHSYDASSGRANIEDIVPYATLLPKARAQKGGVVWQVESEGEDTHVFLARLINDNDTYEEIGLMVILVNMEPLKTSYSEMRSDILRNIMITTNDKRVIFESESSAISPLHLIPDQYDKYGGVVMNESVDQVVSYRRLNVADWVVLSSFSRSALTKEFSNLQNWMWTILIPMILLLSILSLMVSLDIASPIHTVIERMKAYKQGQLVEHTPLGRKDEIGFLAENLESMTTEIDHLMKNIYEEQLHRKESQVRALQAQINPHFLFNTLETINWQAQLADVPEISDMVTSLSTVMEGSLSGDSSLIPLKLELEYVRSYLSIMNHRLGDQLEVTWNVEDRAEGIQVPRLILQPIVENAIEHGVTRQSRVGKISIQAVCHNDLLSIQVTDNGKGVKKEDLVALKSRLEDLSEMSVSSRQLSRSKTPDNKRPSHGHWIGMNNVNRRLKLLYGATYGLDIESEADVYTKVTLNLPMKGDQTHV